MAAMNDITAIFHGLKAAAQLLTFVRGQIDDGTLKLGSIAIDFDDGTSREFSAEEYIALAQDGVARATQIVKQAATDDRRRFD